jgi:hypothetical protein
LGVGVVERHEQTIRLRAHVSEERYFSDHDDLLVPGLSKPGTRTYVHAKPYILRPEITLTVGLHPNPKPTGEVGTVLGSDVSKLRPVEIGNAQAWYYPTKRTVVLWECFLESHYRGVDLMAGQTTKTDNPATDGTNVLVWQGFERFLTELFPDASRLVTTFEPIYERPVFASFLAPQGYTQDGTVRFMKDLPQRVSHSRRSSTSK